MKTINKRLLIIGVAIGIFLCTLIVGVVQIRFQINDILTDSDDDPYTFYRIYAKEGEGYTTLSLSSATSIIKALPKDVSATFESSSSLPRTEVTYMEEMISPRILVTDTNFLLVNDYSILQGRYFDEEDNNSKARVCVIHESMYQALGGEDNMDLIINGEVFHVIGVLSGAPSPVSDLNSIYMSLDELIIMPINTYYEFFMTGYPDQYHLIDHVVAKASKSYTKEAIESKVAPLASRVHRGSLSIEEEGEQEITQLKNTMAIVKKILLIAGIVLFLAGLNIVQITTASLYDIRKEIGLKMALGATKFDIVKEISLDVISCTLKGGYIGVALYAVFFFVVNTYIRDYSALSELLTPLFNQYTEYFRLTFNLNTALIGMFFALVIGFLSAVLPALKAASIDPIVELRRE